MITSNKKYDWVYIEGVTYRIINITNHEGPIVNKDNGRFVIYEIDISQADKNIIFPQIPKYSFIKINLKGTLTWYHTMKVKIRKNYKFTSGYKLFYNYIQDISDISNDVFSLDFYNKMLKLVKKKELLHIYKEIRDEITIDSNQKF